MSLADPVPGNLPLVIERGLHFGPLDLLFKENGAAVNLTGYTTRSIARTEVGSPNELNLDPVIADAAAGRIRIEFTDDETMRDFPAGKYRYNLVLVLTSSGETSPPYLAGTLDVIDQESRT